MNLASDVVYVTGLAVDATFVYVATTGASMDGLISIDKSGGAASPRTYIDPSLGHYGSIATDDKLYACKTGCAGGLSCLRIFSKPAGDAATATELPLPKNFDCTRGRLRLDDQRAYQDTVFSGGNGGYILAVAKASGATVFAAPGPGGDFDVDDAGVYHGRRANVSIGEAFAQRLQRDVTGGDELVDDDHALLGCLAPVPLER